MPAVKSKIKECAKVKVRLLYMKCSLWKKHYEEFILRVDGVEGTHWEELVLV